MNKKECVIVIHKKDQTTQLKEELEKIGYKYTKKILYFLEHHSFPVALHIRKGLAPMYAITSGSLATGVVDRAKESGITIIELK